jgi:hypothetical protein
MEAAHHQTPKKYQHSTVKTVTALYKLSTTNNADHNNDDDDDGMPDPEQILQQARAQWFHSEQMAYRPDVWVGGYSPEYHFHRRRLAASKPVKIDGYKPHVKDSPFQH